MKTQLSIFLCHATENKPAVRRLYNRLRKDGFRPWLDEKDLLPGINWKQDIAKEVKDADIVLVCLSKQAITKRGYFQKEIKIALDAADGRPEDSFYLIPAKLEECDIPVRLSQFQAVNLFKRGGYKHLLSSLHTADRSLHGVATVKEVQETKTQVHRTGEGLRRRIYFSFHYGRDIWRANIIRNTALLSGQAHATPFEASVWEVARIKGEAAVRKLLDDRLDSTSVTVVLIGAETASRRWANYEIDRSIERGKGIVGIYIHGLRGQYGNTDPQGAVPKQLLSGGYVVYDWVKDDGYANLAKWVEAAAKDATR